ncbi:hypothetical protein [Paraburkholderia sp. J76]|uniref:hypothetical protein n=1 Tax=Paraburkholderia sp. J76 TaxID=2805439 RepID=UPI002ABE4C32|nr:hypothetical protein [Paraburkholderia sp. J76]
MAERENGNISNPACFHETPVFVLVQPRADGLLDTAASMTAGGRAVVCHLSFVHALIDLAYRSSRGKHYSVCEASLIGPEVFTNAEGSGLIAQLRLAWPAKNRKVVLAQDGNTATCAYLLRHPIVIAPRAPWGNLQDSPAPCATQLFPRTLPAKACAKGFKAVGEYLSPAFSPSTVDKFGASKTCNFSVVWGIDVCDQ